MGDASNTLHILPKIHATPTKELPVLIVKVLPIVFFLLLESSPDEERKPVMQVLGASNQTLCFCC